METQQHRTVFYSDDTFLFSYQVEEDVVTIHCDVYSWKPSTLRVCYSVFGKFLNSCENSGFSKIVTITPNPKFAKLFGGTTIGKMQKDNKEYEVVVWALK